MDMLPPKLKKLLDKDVMIPESFLEEQLNKADNGSYLGSCSENQYLFIADSFQEITGYPPHTLLHQGIHCWLNLIHGDDVEGTIDRIIRKSSSGPRQDRTTPPPPFKLRYRLKHASGRWIWVEDTKCIISYTREGHVEKVLGCFEDITTEKIAQDLAFKESLDQNKPSGAIFKAWQQVMRAKDRHSLNGPDEIPALTRREKEVLALIGQGLSTKQLADQLYISINTVETHRRNLIEKFNARNSVELVMKASRTFLI